MMLGTNWCVIRTERIVLRKYILTKLIQMYHTQNKIGVVEQLSLRVWSGLSGPDHCVVLELRLHQNLCVLQNACWPESKLQLCQACPDTMWLTSSFGSLLPHLLVSRDSVPCSWSKVTGGPVLRVTPRHTCWLTSAVLWLHRRL